MVYIFLFLIGLVFGSFASALSYRYVTNQNMKGRSKCPSCKKALGVLDLIPLFSFVLSGGKCRYCKKKIPIRYPLQELLMGLLFMLNHYLNGLSFISVILYILLFALIVISVTDLMAYYVPDQMILLFLVVGLLYSFAFGFPLIHMIIMPLLIGFIAFLLKYACLIFFKKHGLGMGDVKIFIISGLYLQVESISAFLLLSGLFGVLMSIIWRASGKKVKRFPFAPAIVVALLLCILFPDQTQIVNYFVLRMY